MDFSSGESDVDSEESWKAKRQEKEEQKKEKVGQKFFDK